MAIKWVPSGAGILVSNRNGYLGRIEDTGRFPGRWVSTDETKTASPAEMAEIGKKCVEIRRQVDSTRNLRRSHFGKR